MAFIFYFFGHAKITEPLNRLLKKKVKLILSADFEREFSLLKEAMCNDVILHSLDYSVPIFVRNDASDVGVGAVIAQKFDGKVRPIVFASKSLKEESVRGRQSA